MRLTLDERCGTKSNMKFKDNILENVEKTCREFFGRKTNISKGKGGSCFRWVGWREEC